MVTVMLFGLGAVTRRATAWNGGKGR